MLAGVKKRQIDLKRGHHLCPTLNTACASKIQCNAMRCNTIYYIKVSGIASGNKLIKNDTISSHVKI